MAASSYDKLLALSKSISLMNSITHLLEWDQETYMPKDAIELRSQQIEIMASLLHKQRTGKGFAKALSALIDLKTGEVADSTLSLPQIAALREWRRDYLRAIKLPNSFVKQFAKTTSAATHVWQTAREHNDFKSFAPYLEKVVSLNRKKADILGFQEHPYDALLDLYEPEMKTSYLTPMFAKLKMSLTQLLKDISVKPVFPEDFLYRHCPRHKQLDFAHKILHKMGFHSSTSRLDTSSHPFCTELGPKDTRMTTKVHPENIMFNIGAVLHEGGHGLYNMNLPVEHFGSPLSEAVSLGIHESQSRWWETLIGQSHPFWQYFFPLLQEELPEQFGNVQLEDFYHAINIARPGFIRIEADEVSYNLHVIVRFEIEKGLIEGTLKVKEIPDAWNSKMREYLGISPEFDGQGCLQDIHWSLGFMGYFPTYTLGNLYSVQFFEAFEKAHPNWREHVAQGSLDFIRDWLKENIHKYGRQFTPGELCQRATGKPLSQEPYVEYLTKKYRKLYRL
ncbi:MAG: carboxypeptidase M32 [Verrucomicrobia bacterium]|nr:carboxypeptidase M32 [Verrucomicrobiota bacterium]